MKKYLLCALMVVAFPFSNLQAKDSFKVMHASDLAAMISAKDSKLAIFDANTEKTRKEDGVIPGAKLLSSSANFDVAKEMPAEKDTKLVFYCANTKCAASHDAAKRAMKNGYTDVSVMVDGIQGWKKAGQPTTMPQS